MFKIEKKYEIVFINDRKNLLKRFRETEDKATNAQINTLKYIRVFATLLYSMRMRRIYSGEDNRTFMNAFLS